MHFIEEDLDVRVEMLLWYGDSWGDLLFFVYLLLIQGYTDWLLLIQLLKT